MKTFKLFSVIIALFAMLVLVSCGDDESDPLVSVTGKVTYTNVSAINAAGAVVYLTGTSSTLSTIADENGNFAFSRVDPGSYMLNAAYFTDNTNISGRLDGLNFGLEEPVDITVGSSNVTQDLALVSVGQTDVDPFDAKYVWNPTGGTNQTGAYEQSGTWTYDATHSPVDFAFAYRDNVAEFTGTFAQMSIVDFNFKPNDLSGSKLEFEVDVASINTFNPGGRDNLLTDMYRPAFSPTSVFQNLGCIMGTFGITADGTLPSTITTNPKRYASFKATSISKLGDGYVAKGNLVFNGVTKVTDIWFRAMPAWLDASNNRSYTGFEGRFFMNAKSDFNITSSSVNDAVVAVHISIVVYKQN
jgi:polyisoprenoid-binding protein YceI